MTEGALAASRAAAPNLDWIGWTNTDGPAAIQGAEDGAASVPPLLILVEKAVAQRAEAIVIACFDDTGLAEARAMSPVPVIGIGQASFTMARLVADRFSVVTTLAVSIPVIEANITTQGFAPWLCRVHASGVPVLTLESDPEAAIPPIRAAIETATAQGPHPIVLGCSAMVNVAARLRAETGLVLIDGVTAAARLIAAQTAFRPGPRTA